VCEVAYDHFQGGHRFRHLAQFLRWRTDVDPRDCTFDQVRPGRG
jgi:ATP-dependent DNA ligase